MAKKKNKAGSKSLYNEFLKLQAKDDVRKLQRKARRVEKKLSDADGFGHKDYVKYANDLMRLNTDAEKLQRKYRLKKRRSKVEVRAEKRSGKLKGQTTEHDFWDGKKLRKEIAKGLNKKKRINGVSTNNKLEALAALDDILTHNSPYMVITITENQDEINVSLREISDDELEDRKERNAIWNKQRIAYKTRKDTHDKNKGLAKTKRFPNKK